MILRDYDSDDCNRVPLVWLMPNELLVEYGNVHLPGMLARDAKECIELIKSEKKDMDYVLERTRILEIMSANLLKKLRKN